MLSGASYSNMAALTNTYSRVFHNAHFKPLRSTWTCSFTTILISRSLINLQEADLHHIRVDPDDPLYISNHLDESLPSFVASPGLVGPTIRTTR